MQLRSASSSQGRGTVLPSCVMIRGASYHGVRGASPAVHLRGASYQPGAWYETDRNACRPRGASIHGAGHHCVDRNLPGNDGVHVPRGAWNGPCRQAYCNGVLLTTECVVCHRPNGGRRTTVTERRPAVVRNLRAAAMRRGVTYHGVRDTDRPCIYGLHHTAEAAVRNYRNGLHHTVEATVRNYRDGVTRITGRVILNQPPCMPTG